MDVSKTSFVCYGCLKDVLCMLWMSQRRLLYVMDVSKTSFVCYGCLQDVLCMLWMSQRRLLFVMDVSKTSFVCYGCLKNLSLLYKKKSLCCIENFGNYRLYWITNNYWWLIFVKIWYFWYLLISFFIKHRRDVEKHLEHSGEQFWDHNSSYCWNKR